MAKKIKVNIAGAAFTGKIVTFKAPCDCTEATGLVIGEDTYDVVDALGNCITGSYLAWRSGALVSVALDVEDKTATLQSSIVGGGGGGVAGVSSFNGRTGAVTPQNGDYTAAMVGAAPAGYGLGGVFGHDFEILDSSHDLNAIRGNGWYHWTDPAPTNAPCSYCIMRVWSGLGSYTMQECMYGGTMGVVMQRTRDGEAWTEWEYVNPPLNIGTEYRTTERYNGKPVYVKAVNCGNFPASEYTEVPHLIKNVETVVRSVANIGTGLPWGYDGTHRQEFFVTMREVYLYSKNPGYTGSAAIVTIYYTKTTD